MQITNLAFFERLAVCRHDSLREERGGESAEEV